MTHLGLVVALAREAEMLTQSQVEKNVPTELQGGSWLYVSGAGALRAKHAADALVECGCRVLVSWGTVGALDHHLKPGQLFLPEAIHTESGNVYPVDRSWHMHLRRLFETSLDIVLGNLLTVDRIITSVSEKQDLKKRHSAVAVDMEAAAVAEVAMAYNLPFFAIKTPVDLADQRLPLWLIRSLDPWGHVLKKNLVKNVFHVTFADGVLLRQLFANFRRSQQTLAVIARKTDGLSFRNTGPFDTPAACLTGTQSDSSQ